MHRLRTFTLLALSAAIAAPAAVWAQNIEPNTAYITGLVTQTSSILRLLLPLVVTLALLLFFWGLAMFILNADNEEARGKGRSMMVWGLVALFVIVAVWGLVGLLAQIFGVKKGGSVDIPGVQSPDTSGGLLGGEDI